jgi:hypothetical protein
MAAAITTIWADRAGVGGFAHSAKCAYSFGLAFLALRGYGLDHTLQSVAYRGRVKGLVGF